MKRLKFPGTLCKSEKVGRAEQLLGHLIGPLGCGFLSIMVNSYLNVYYTDVCGLGRLWNGSFMSIYPMLVKILDVVTYMVAGYLVDRTVSKQGKARPYLLLSAVLMPISAMLLFLVPSGNDFLTAAAVLGSNVLFFAVVVTLYCTANTLMVPLSSTDAGERSKLAVTANAQMLITGTVVAMVFPTIILPIIGVEQGRWITVMLITAIIAVPLILLQYLFTRERVTEKERAEGGAEKQEKLSLKTQLKCCLKSHSWLILMIYFLAISFVNSISSQAIFYYCNWVLGSYNDGITQVLFYAIGNLPMGIGCFLCNPICKKLGRTRAIVGGFALSVVGLLICILFPTNLPLVLAGQFIKACGTIPSGYLATVLLGEALDDVHEKSGVRCDGFTSSLYNSILTITGGVATCLLNAGMAIFGYIAPASGVIAAQPAAMQNFFVFCQMGAPLLIYPLLAVLMWRFGKSRKSDGKGETTDVARAA